MSDRPLAEYVNDVASWARKHFHEGASTVAILDDAVEACRENDAMREALRRLGNDAERLVADGAADREATPETIERLWGIATGVFAAACLYAPKESGQ